MTTVWIVTGVVLVVVVGITAWLARPVRQQIKQ